MRRTQVYLTEVQHRKLEVMAKSLGLTMAELIRQGVDLVLCEKARLGQDPLVDLIGQAGPMGRSDIALSMTRTKQASLWRASGSSRGSPRHLRRYRRLVCPAGQ